MLLKNSPTAQAWPETGSAAAAFRTFSLALGLGLVTTLQLLPFHCSITVCVTPVLRSVFDPTAQMSVAETMAIPHCLRQFASIWCEMRILQPQAAKSASHTRIGITRARASAMPSST